MSTALLSKSSYSSSLVTSRISIMTSALKLVFRIRSLRERQLDSISLNCSWCMISLIWSFIMTSMPAMTSWAIPLSKRPTDVSIFISSAASPEMKRSSSLTSSAMVCSSSWSIGTGSAASTSNRMLERKRLRSSVSTFSSVLTFSLVSSAIISSPFSYYAFITRLHEQASVSLFALGGRWQLEALEALQFLHHFPQGFLVAHKLSQEIPEFLPVVHIRQDLLQQLL